MKIDEWERAFTLQLGEYDISETGDNSSKKVRIGFSIRDVAEITTPQLEALGLFDHKQAESFAKTIFEANGKTDTGHWMDKTGRFKVGDHNSSVGPDGFKVGWHRVDGHKFSDLFEVASDSDLSTIDFLGHLGTDIVTKNGLPTLGEDAVRKIAHIFDTNINNVMTWASFDILDATGGVFSIFSTINSVRTAFSGDGPGAYDAAKLASKGVIKGLIGAKTVNPVLLSSGAADTVLAVKVQRDYLKLPKIKIGNGGYGKAIILNELGDDLLKSLYLPMVVNAVSIMTAKNKDKELFLGVLEETLQTVVRTGLKHSVSSTVNLSLSAGQAVVHAGEKVIVKSLLDNDERRKMKIAGRLAMEQNIKRINNSDNAEYIKSVIKNTRFGNE